MSDLEDLAAAARSTRRPQSRRMIAKPPMSGWAFGGIILGILMTLGLFIKAVTPSPPPAPRPIPAMMPRAASVARAGPAATQEAEEVQASYDGQPNDSEKTVHVRGYYRKNGTYVQPYDRRPPRRR